MSYKKIENPHSENLAMGAPITGMVPILEKMKVHPNISENSHLEKLDDFCDDAIHYLNNFFENWSIEILST